MAPRAVRPVAQSPKNNIKYLITIFNITHAGADDRNPPARIAVLIQARTNKEATAQHTKHQSQRWCSGKPAGGAKLYIKNKKHTAHSDVLVTSFLCIPSRLGRKYFPTKQPFSSYFKDDKGQFIPELNSHVYKFILFSLFINWTGARVLVKGGNSGRNITASMT